MNIENKFEINDQVWVVIKDNFNDFIKITKGIITGIKIDKNDKGNEILYCISSLEYYHTDSCLYLTKDSALCAASTLMEELL